MTDAPSSGFRLNGRHVAAGLTLFFAVVIGLDVLFASLAYKTFSGQAATNAYTAGLKYNETLAQRRAQAQLGWTAEVRREPGAVVLAFTGADGAPVDGLSVAAVLERPATEIGRRSLVLAAQGGGLYRLDLAGLDGAWDIAATARGQKGERFELAHRLVLP